MPRQRTLVDNVYYWLRDQCAQRRFPKYEHLHAGELAHELGVSLSTVRQALVRAIDAGWVVRLPNGRPVLNTFPARVRRKSTNIDPGENLVEEARGAILEKVLSGELPPNSRLYVRRLSKELDINATSVREALESLASRGLLYRERRCGWRVTTLTNRELRDAFRLRLIMEPLIVRYAACRIADDEICLLDEINDRIRGTNPALQHEARQADYLFHTTLAQLSGRRMLVSTLEPLLQKVFMNPGGRGGISTVAEHDSVIDALRERNAVEAAERMRQHLKCSRTRYLNDVARSRTTRIPDDLRRESTSNSAIQAEMHSAELEAGMVRKRRGA